MTATVARKQKQALQVFTGGIPVSGQPHPSQFSLLKQRRFAPFFWTQFLGAANDNVSSSRSP